MAPNALSVENSLKKLLLRLLLYECPTKKWNVVAVCSITRVWKLRVSEALAVSKSADILLSISTKHQHQTY